MQELDRLQYISEEMAILVNQAWLDFLILHAPPYSPTEDDQGSEDSFTLRVIAHLLEAGSKRSALLRWGFFNTIFEQKEGAEAHSGRNAMVGVRIDSESWVGGPRAIVCWTVHWPAACAAGEPMSM